MTGRYYINGLDLYTLSGAIVLKSEGEIDILKPKPRLKVEWPDENGEDVDLTGTIFEPRRISLECLIDNSTASAAQAGLDSLMSTLNAADLKEFKSYKDNFMPHYIYFDSPNGGVERFNGGRTLLFKLNLVEPRPVFSSYFISRYTANYTVVTITVSPDGIPVDIYWGDGAVTHGVISEYVHVYPESSIGSSDLVVFGGEKAISVTMTQKKSVAVTPITDGGGWIEFNPIGVEYGASRVFNVNRIILLTAYANTGKIFVGWEVNGQNAGSSNPLELQLNENKNVRAIFSGMEN